MSLATMKNTFLKKRLPVVSEFFVKYSKTKNHLI